VCILIGIGVVRPPRIEVTSFCRVQPPCVVELVIIGVVVASFSKETALGIARRGDALFGSDGIIRNVICLLSFGLKMVCFLACYITN